MFKLITLSCTLIYCTILIAQDPLRMDTIYSGDSLVVGYGSIYLGKKEGVWKYLHLISGDKWNNHFLRDTLVSSTHLFPDQSYKISVSSGSNQKYTSITYDNFNRIINITTISSGKPDGLFIEFSESGSIVLHRFYVEGKLEGREVGYHGNGLIKRLGSWHSNARCGIWEFYHENGLVSSKGAYTLLNISEYDLNEIDREFMDSWVDDSHLNVKDGSWLYFDEYGNPVKEELFKFGKLIRH